MPDDSLMAEKQPDRFTTESPIRAFTEFRVSGTWAIGKGFRPSLAHMHTYLDAMQHKEGWHLVQMLDGGTLDPTLIFQRDRIMSFTVPNREPDPIMPELRIRGKIGFEDVDAFLREQGFSLAYDKGDLKLYRVEPAEFVGTQLGEREMTEEEAIDEDIRDLDRYQARRDTLAGLPDDPVNPRHYRGTACAEIGELLTGNSYQTLKYNWRLGEKEDPCIEIDKSIWYLDREIALAAAGFRVKGDLPDQAFFAHRVQGENEHVKLVCGLLVAWNRTGDSDCLHQLRVKLTDKRVHLDCGSGLAV